jgi:hypothetical protein
MAKYRVRRENGYMVIDDADVIRVEVTPRVQRVLDVIAAIEGRSVDEAVEDYLNDLKPGFDHEAEDNECEPIAIMNVSFWTLLKIDPTPVQMACAAFDHVLPMNYVGEGPWSYILEHHEDEEAASELPKDAVQARAELKIWLAGDGTDAWPEKVEALCIELLEHALAGEWSKLRPTSAALSKEEEQHRADDGGS